MHHINSKILKQNGKKRFGKGFSRDELKNVGLSLTDSKKFAIRIDKKRKTAHEENINLLKTYVKENPAPLKTKTAAV